MAIIAAVNRADSMQSVSLRHFGRVENHLNRRDFFSCFDIVLVISNQVKNPVSFLCIQLVVRKKRRVAKNNKSAVLVSS